MSDNGRPVELGVFPDPSVGRLDDLLDVVRVADREGLDLVGIQDHPYQRRFLDTFSLLAWLAAVTERIRVFPDVACLPLRHPAMIARDVATVDLLSGGRMELGLGAGGFWDAIAAMGGPRRGGAEALDALEEAVDVIRRWWNADRGIRLDGEHYPIHGAHGGPAPAHDVEIWFGVYGPRAVELCGRIADGWLPSLPMTDLPALAERQHRLDEAARESGRDPADIRRLLNISGTLTDGDTAGFLHGPRDRWIEDLTGLVVEHGFDTFILWPDESDPVEQTRRFAHLADELSAAVDRARSSA